MKNENRIERVKEIYMKYFPQLRQLEDNNRVFFDNVSRLAVPPEIKPIDLYLVMNEIYKN